MYMYSLQVNIGRCVFYVLMGLVFHCHLPGMFHLVHVVECFFPKKLT